MHACQVGPQIVCLCSNLGLCSGDRRGLSYSENIAAMVHDSQEVEMLNGIMGQRSPEFHEVKGLYSLFCSHDKAGPMQR